MDKFFQNLTISHLFRYGFAGFALLLAIALAYPSLIAGVRATLGDVLLVVIAFSVGGAIYVAYRAMFDLMIYWIHYWVHYVVGKIWPSHLCKFRGMHRDVAPQDGNNAYRAIRDMPTSNDAVRGQFDRFNVEHAEIHMLYAFAFVLGLVSFLTYVHPPTSTGTTTGTTSSTWNSSLAWGAAGLIFIIGMFRDIGLCARECHYVLIIRNEEKRLTTLKRAHLVANGNSRPG